MDGDTVYSFVHTLDTYFGLIGIINEQAKYKFASLFDVPHRHKSNLNKHKAQSTKLWLQTLNKCSIN